MHTCQSLSHSSHLNGSEPSLLFSPAVLEHLEVARVPVRLLAARRNDLVKVIVHAKLGRIHLKVSMEEHAQRQHVNYA
eukprot:6198367-Pleurochrysis_carterae.AAC.1